MGPRPVDARAVVVLIHGRGGDGPAMIEMTRDITDADDVAWLAPTAADNTWYPEGFMAPWEANQPWFDHAIDRFTMLLNKLNDDGVADERIVLLGFSQGACLTAELLLRRPRRYGAVAILTGGYVGPPGTYPQPPPGIDGVPVYMGTSDVDEWVPIERTHDTAAIIKAAGADLQYVVFKGMDHVINDDERAAAGALIDAIT